jgi:hypothetical protein
MKCHFGKHEFTEWVKLGRIVNSWKTIEYKRCFCCGFSEERKIYDFKEIVDFSYFKLPSVYTSRHN